MSEVLLELFSEEIPARMQVKAADDLRRLVLAGFEKAGVSGIEAAAYVTPRRLVLHLNGVPAQTAAKHEERKGPRVGAPDKALEGFLRGAGLASIDDAEVRSDPKKGDFYVAVIAQDGRPVGDLLGEIVPDVIRNFPWPKSMRWGAPPAPDSRQIQLGVSGNLGHAVLGYETPWLRWVRPLQRIVCVMDGAVVPFDVGGIASGNVSSGHRFMGPDEFEVSSFTQYRDQLRAQKVILDFAERAALIGEQAQGVAKKAKLELVEDAGLAAENAGLNEWPTVLMGSFDKEFLDVPDKVLTLAMKSHQKCFSLVDPKTKALTNKFLMVSNLVAEDGGKKIVAGNERVIRARLSDAKFFWDNDVKKPLADVAKGLADVTFHEKLGTQAQRVERVTALAVEIAEAIGADAKKVEAAAGLCKADLLSEMVYELPELQGYVGHHLALAQKIDADVARACEDHYKPVGASDDVPGDMVSVAVGLADKLDTLTGFWAIDEKPTGSKDPYALRRATLGFIKVILDQKLRLSLEELLPVSRLLHTKHGKLSEPKTAGSIEDAADVLWSGDLGDFFADRLKVYLRDRGARHDLIDAVFALGGQDDLLMIVKRVEALGAFLETDDGANLLAGTKRAANILRIEEKKDKATFDGKVDASLLSEAAEKELAAAIDAVTAATAKAVEAEDFEGAMGELAKLRKPVDAFFDGVTVNADDAALRANRLKLLNQIREATRQVADFSKIEG